MTTAGHWNAYTRCVDALNRLNTQYERTDIDTLTDDALTIRYLVAALDQVLRNSPGLGEALESTIAEACRAGGVDGP